MSLEETKYTDEGLALPEAGLCAGEEPGVQDPILVLSLPSCETLSKLSTFLCLVCLPIK